MSDDVRGEEPWLVDEYRALRDALTWIETRTGEATDDMAVTIRRTAHAALDRVLDDRELAFHGDARSGETDGTAKSVANAGAALILSTPGLTAEALDAYTDVVRREMRAGARSSEPSRIAAGARVIESVDSLCDDIEESLERRETHWVAHVRQALARIRRIARSA